MSDDTLLKRMRELRRKAEWLNRTLVEDYCAFLNPADRLTFLRLPTILKEGKDVGVTPTCTALMALALSKSCADFYRPKSRRALPDAIAPGLSDQELQERVDFGLTKKDLSAIMKAAITSLLDAEWDTGRLVANNAFTASLVLRAAGVLLRGGYIRKDELTSLKRTWPDHERVDDRKPPQEPKEITEEFRRFHNADVTTIAERVANKFPASLRVQKYPPSPTIAYWLLDAVGLLDVDLSKEVAFKIVVWAAQEFTRQVSLVSANDHARMDPIAMAMASCLCRLLRRIAPTCSGVRDALAEVCPENGEDGALDLPTDTELRSAIDLFLRKQNDAGVWEKYFPLFHYPRAGANHCWHFEVLEAVLNEFPEKVREAPVLDKVGCALKWLERNRLSWRNSRGTEFTGWNSGGDITALRAGEPESWPTGVAHMFLWRLRQALGFQIQEEVLAAYRERVHLFAKPDAKKWKDYLDCSLPDDKETVRGVVEREILGPSLEAINEYNGPERTVRTGEEKTVALGDGTAPFSSSENQDNPQLVQSPVLRTRVGPDFRLKKRKARSALLFGPPGTSKTSLAKAVASRLGWPFVELSPSDFLKGGLEGIYGRVNKVFDDLMDLFGVVVLFDEMDALVQSREELGETTPTRKSRSPQLDVTQQFLTTSMLPKLLKLREQRRVIFFMATNHQKDFDAAIKRPGRFDLLIPMGPPSYDEKQRGLKEQWFPEQENKEDRDRVIQMFAERTESIPTRAAIERFTYAEMDALFEFVRRKDEGRNLRRGLEKFTKAQFESVVQEWCQKIITLRDGSSILDEWKSDQREFRIQVTETA